MDTYCLSGLWVWEFNDCYSEIGFLWNCGISTILWKQLRKYCSPGVRFTIYIVIFNFTSKTISTLLWTFSKLSMCLLLQVVAMLFWWGNASVAESLFHLQRLYEKYESLKVKSLRDFIIHSGTIYTRWQTVCYIIPPEILWSAEYGII